MSTDTHGTTEESKSLEDKFEEIIRKYYDPRDGSPNRLGKLLERYPQEQQSLTIDWYDVYKYEKELAEDILDSPEVVRDYAEKALHDYDIPIDVDLSDATIRFANLPPDAERKIGRLGTDDENRLRRITGQVTKKSPKRIRVVEAAWECQRCGTITRIPQLAGKQEPHECDGCQRKGPFIRKGDESEQVNFQRLRMQLPPELSQGMGAEHIDVRVEEELVNSVEVGDRVTVTGIPRTHEVDEGDDLILDWHAEAMHFEREDAGLDEIDYSDSIDEIKELANSENPFGLLVDSIKPTHRGNEDAKLAIGLQLFGGVRKVNEDGSTVRGCSHVLLVGDPGTDKTGLLTYASDLAPRSVFTSGEGSSGVGLTAAVVSDDFSNGPTLEAGAMVLANDGLVALDEFDKLDEKQQTSMNEALSKQTVSIAKWGINATMNARTTLLAAANPEYGRFDLYESIPSQLDLDPTLISRFDLIFIIKDKPDEEADRELAEHINTAAYIGAKRASGESVSEELTSKVTPAVAPDLLRKWIAYARDNCTPVLTQDARDYIKEEYVKIRQASGDDDAVPVTARKLQALHRLAEASARIRLSPDATLDDAELAVSIVKDCLQDIGIDPETGELDADVIETGTSKTQRQRIKNVKGLILDHESDTDHGAPLVNVIDSAESIGIDESKVRHEIQKLKDRGEIYEPADEHYRPTK
jgi:replicative DNA helicase Mcm